MKSYKKYYLIITDLKTQKEHLKHPFSDINNKMLLLTIWLDNLMSFLYKESQLLQHKKERLRWISSSCHRLKSLQDFSLFMLL